MTIAFFGDGAAEEGIFYESARLCRPEALAGGAGLREQRPVHTPRPRNASRPGEPCAMWLRALACDEASDGNDVRRWRPWPCGPCDRGRDDGPVFLELHTYRWREHCGPNEDVHLGYRSRAELTAWQERCPLRRLEERTDGGRHLGRR